MLTFVPSPINGIIIVILATCNTLFWTALLFPISIIKFIIPINIFRNICSKIIVNFANNWVMVNKNIIKMFINIEWDIEGIDDLKLNSWYLVISNHQSNLDIYVLQSIFYHKIPFLKFFLKSQLIWVPVLGIAWWALDFPFMKRYSKEFIKKNPHLKGKDIEATKKACKKYESNPTSIMNFVEGTRLTENKHLEQNSPFNNLLKPRAGGTGFVITVMGNQLENILDVTLVYPDGKNGLWDFFCNRIHRVIVRIKIIPIDEKLKGDYISDEKFKAFFQNWINDLWHSKDKFIKTLQDKD